MADPAVSLPVSHRETEPEAALLVELRLEHLIERFRLQDRAVGAFAVLEQGDQKAAEVGHGGDQAAGGGVAEFKRWRREGPTIIGPHDRVGEFRRSGRSGVEVAGIHAERGEDAVSHHVGEGHARGSLDGEAHNTKAGVGVLGFLSWRERHCGVVEAGDGFGQTRPGGVEVVADGGLSHQAGAVGHQVPQGDRLVEGVLRMQVGQDVGDGGVEVELALLDKLHDGDVGEQLRDGADVVGGFGRGRGAVFGIGQAKSPGPDDLVAADQRNRKGGNLLLLDFPCQE